METLLLVVTVVCVLIAFVTSIAVWTRLREAHERTAARVDTLRALALADDTPTMFGAVVEHGAPARRWVAVTIVAVLMASIAGTTFALHKAPPSESVRLPESSLELLTLRETTDRHGAFVVTGQVRNSSSGESLQGVAAFVDLYDRTDQFVTGTKTALRVLHAGEASSFTVSLPRATGVARYRVQFRRADGSVVPHLDRRASSVAQTGERTGHERLE